MSGYGSDLVVDLLRAVGITHVALNPGATFRGLHDSLVNHGKGEPALILTLHEEIAVALAHGYAKARGAPMAAAVHDIVGLQHASMAIFNAFCDRAPILVLGATGPMDAARGRPWIDWIHTALVQGTQVRDYVKLDDQPASVAAIPEALLRCWRLARTEPQGPVYLCLDAGLQEEALDASVPIPDVRRFQPAAPPHASPRDLEEAARRLVEARAPLIVTEALGRRPEATPVLCRLAERLAARHAGLLAEWQATAKLERTLIPLASSVFAAEIWDVIRDEDWVLANGTAKGWARRLWDWRPERTYGGSGGAGLGYGLPAALGVTLAHRGSSKVCVKP